MNLIDNSSLILGFHCLLLVHHEYYMLTTMKSGLINKKCILAALVAIIMEEIFRRSHFCDFLLFESLCKVTLVLSCGVAACKLGVDIYLKRISSNELTAIAIGFLYIVFLVLRGQSDAFMVLWLFAAALHDVDFEKIVKVSSISIICALFIVYISSIIGIIDNTVVVRIREEEEKNRNGMGFMASYQSAYFLFFAFLTWCYFRKNKLSWYEIITIAVLNHVVFWQCDTRGPYQYRLVKQNRV